MADTEEYKIFLKRYRKRIQSVNDWQFTVENAYELFKEEGEDRFLEVLEDKEGFTEFCNNYYDILRERFNICGGGMRDHYQMYKVELKGNDDAYENYLRRIIKNFDKCYR